MGDVMTFHTLTQVVEGNFAPSVDWLSRRLNRGEITGYKVGRSWLMSDQDIADMLESRRNPKKQGFTKGTSRRLA